MSLEAARLNLSLYVMVMTFWAGTVRAQQRYSYQQAVNKTCVATRHVL
jgi:hypothetical protein